MSDGHVFNHSVPATAQICPLCAHSPASFFHRDRFRTYLNCPVCSLVFVPTGQHLSLSQEKARYDQHNNHPFDPGYRRFLSRLLRPLQESRPPPASGLDFGCGPGPALIHMCLEAGYDMIGYDPFYAPDPDVLNQTYDLITCTEVVEHLRQPGSSLPFLWSRLRPGGWLCVMTKLVLSREAFATWHYIRDQTHVSFFSRATFSWLAAQYRADLFYPDRDVIFLHKTADIREVNPL